MKIIKKTILYIVICLTLATSAFAINDNSTNIVNTASEYDNVARTEEVVWVYMPIDGVRHMRLWSRTRGIWLTDWIPCD